MKKLLAVVLAALTLLSLLSVSASAGSVYRPDGLCDSYLELMADGTDEMILGSISAKYESNGDPGRISSASSDPVGGVSYGAYMFVSKYDVPIDFARWCISSGEGILTGTRLVAAYELDGQTYGTNFNTAWTDIASENAQGFLLLQHNYIKVNYYDVMVGKLSRYYADFNIENYTMALKNVIWSRTVHNGVNSKLIFNGIDKIGGVGSHTEEELIRAIYAESACVVAAAPNTDSVKMKAEDAQKLGMDSSLLSGRYLRYYSRQSSYTQVSIFRRVTVNEPKDVFAMYASYTGRTVPNTTVTPNVDLSGSSTTDPADPTDPGTDSTVSNIIIILKGAFELFKVSFNAFVKLIKVIATWIKSMK